MLLLSLAVGLLAGSAKAIDLSVSSSGGNASSALAHGIMFEDINHSGDGGIYAEVIQNRAFQGSIEFPAVLEPWSAVGNAKLSLQQLATPLSAALPNSMQVDTTGVGVIGILNPGWFGIDVQPQTYTGSFWVLGAYNGRFTVKLQSNQGSTVFASAIIESEARNRVWIQHNFTLHPRAAAPDSNNVFVIEFQAGQGPLNFNLISLFPPTFNNRPNGLRIDIMEALKGLNPSFLRFPGGNNIEGDSIAQQRWQWNLTIGPLTERPGRPGTWGYENTDGLGLIEYLNWCVDLDMEPILAVWDGFYLGGSTPDVIPEDELDPYVEDVLNELEFIMGPVSSTFGALRASLGFPDPWVINYVEIGNEDQFAEASYIEYRYAAFASAITAQYPHITPMSSAGDRLAQSPSSATDFHQYTRPDIFVSEFNRWDNMAESDHPLLIGEYAVLQGNVADGSDVNFSAPHMPFPSWVGAVAEAVFSIGAERNSFGIIGMSYAPTLQNINSVQWTPDLISFTADPAEDILSTSYRVIELLSNSRYIETVPVAITSNDTFGPSYWVAGTSGPGQFTFKAAVYNATETQKFNVGFDGIKAGAKAKLTVLTAPDGLSMNVLNGPDVVTQTVKTIVAADDGTLSFKLENYSVAVLTT